MEAIKLKKNCSEPIKNKKCSELGDPGGWEGFREPGGSLKMLLIGGTLEIVFQ
jgi:hypothetical protein